MTVMGGKRTLTRSSPQRMVQAFGGTRTCGSLGERNEEISNLVHGACGLRGRLQLELSDRAFGSFDSVCVGASP